MIISSDYHDFYDGANDYSDKSIVYIRKPESIKYDKALSYKAVDASCNWSYREVLLDASLFFCGKRYYCIKCDIDSGSKMLYFWSYDSFCKWVEERNSKEVVIEFELGSKFIPEVPSRIKKAFEDRSISDTEMKYLIDNKITSIQLNFNSYFGSYTSFGGMKYEINPILKDIGFHKIMDPWQATQELQMWLGGVLSNNPQTPVKLPDTAIAQKHGFDKWSFRKMKEVK